MSRNYKKTLSDMLLLAIILLISSVSIKIGAIVIGMIGLMELLTDNNNLVKRREADWQNDACLQKRLLIVMRF